VKALRFPYRRGTARTVHSFCALTRGLPVEGDIAVRVTSMSLRFAATHASAEEGQEDAIPASSRCGPS